MVDKHGKFTFVLYPDDMKVLGIEEEENKSAVLRVKLGLPERSRVSALKSLKTALGVSEDLSNAEVIRLATAKLKEDTDEEDLEEDVEEESEKE